MKKIGIYNYNKDMEIYEIENRSIVLYGWNGEKYLHCFELDKNNKIILENITVTPIYDGNKIIDYQLMD